uniref:PX domain-containing protein n=1 Tax=Aureoumbra lagunensis TaxID=44058 RepID=A0A7S3JQL3_9STRA
MAWHLISKTLKVEKAQDLKRILDESPHLIVGNERDALPILRPVHCDGIPMNPATRACGWLQVIFVEAQLQSADGEIDYIAFHQEYIFTVVYCGRIGHICKRYTDFFELNRQMANELLMIPGFPDKSIWFKVFGGDWNKRGQALASYANRVHASLAARGVFSPRLLAFLGVDAARVHIEEDGRISKQLDSYGAQQGSAWHMIEEGWLKRWRKFILGRAARRYDPPGPITNELLLVPRDVAYGYAALANNSESTKNTDKTQNTDKSTALAVVTPTTSDKEDNGKIEKNKLSNQDIDSVLGPKRRMERKYQANVREVKNLAARENRHVYLPPAVEEAAKNPAETVTEIAIYSDQHEPLTIGKHYRSINYNLWVYWKMVHGGGPCISRKSKEINSAPACGSGAEARSRLQRFGRMCVAKNQKNERYWKHLSHTAPGVRAVLLEYEQDRLKKRATKSIQASKDERTKSRLKDAARYTQRTWRNKKQYAFNDDNVRVQKHAQEVFASADGEVEHAAPGAPLVVEEGEAVVKLGGAETFDVKFTDAEGPLPFTLKKHSSSELTFVQKVDRRKLGVEGNNEDRDVPLSSAARKAREQLTEDAVLLVINNYPVSSLSHKHVMSRLTAAKWPLILRFERPLLPKDVISLSEIVDLAKRDDEVLRDDDFKLQMLKRLLHMGIKVLKYGRQGKPHATTLYLNNTLIFWEIGKADRLKNETPHLSRKYDLTKGVNIYDLKYIRINKVSPVFRTLYGRKAVEDHCFSIFTDNRTLDFEINQIDGDTNDADLTVARRLIAWTFDKIIKEARGSKIFVDKTGAPIRRTQPKKRLRMVR